MKLQILHDEAGNICACFAPTEGRRKGGIQSPGPDRTVIEVDMPEIALATDAEQPDRVSATLSHVMQHYEVRSGRLVERSAKSAR